MPRLPRTPLHEVQPVQNNRSVTQVQRVTGEDAVGDALGKAGNAAFEIGSRLREAQITNEVAKAHNDLNLKLDAEYRQLEKDTGDPAALEAKWQERSKAILAETSGGMTSPMHRRLFNAQAAQMAERYQIKTRDLTRRRQVDGAIADSKRQLDALGEIAVDPEVSLEVLQSNTDNTMAAAKRLYKSGFIDENQLATWEVMAENQLALGKSTRNEKRVSDLMDAGDTVSIAQARLLMEDKDFRANILPDRREALDDALKVKAQAADAFSKADQLMAESGGDYGKAISGAREIQDPELRQNVESRLTTMKEQDNQANIMRQRELQNAGMDILLTGKGISSIPTDVYADADAKTKEYWQDYVFQQRQREQSMATMSAQEKAALREFEGYVKSDLKGISTTDRDLYLQGPDSWRTAAPEVYNRFIQLGPTDQRDILNDIASKSQSGDTVTKADAVYRQLLAEAERVLPDLADKDKKDKPWAVALRGKLRTAAEDEARSLGGADLTVDRSRQIVGKEAASVTTKKGGFLGFGAKEKPIYMADPNMLAAGTAEERRRRALEIAADPQLGVYYVAARKKLADQGKSPSEYEIASEALRMKQAEEMAALPGEIAGTLNRAGDMIGRMTGTN